MSRAALLLCLLAVGCGPRIGGRCVDHDDCAGLDGAYCAGAGVCTRDCSVDACDEGTTCTTTGTRQVCLRSCDRDGDCLSREACDTEQGACLIEDPLANP